MNRSYLILFFCFLIFFSCSSVDTISDSTIAESVPQGNAPHIKPVIALLPVEYNRTDEVEKILGEAYSLTLNNLLNSMQTYDVRKIPSSYQIEDLATRGFDNILTAEIKKEKDGALKLSARVFDPYNGEERISLSETTYDFLSLFSMAEEMVNRMVEEFYGEHIGFSSIRVRKEESFHLFVDGEYRIPDESGLVSVLSGTHRILIFGENGKEFYFDEILECPEGENLDILNYDDPLIKRIYLSREKNLRIDGNPDDWDSLEIQVDDEDFQPIESSALDFQWLKVTADQKHFYALARLAGHFQYPNSNFMLELQPATSRLNTRMTLYSDSSGNLYPELQVREDDPYGPAGTYKAAGPFIELSQNFKELELFPETPYILSVKMRKNDDWRNPVDTAVMLEQILFTENPEPELFWLNREFTPGSGDSKAAFKVPPGLIKLDRSRDDWSFVPIVTENSANLSEGELKLLKYAISDDRLFLYLECLDEWDKKKNLSIELDGGDDSIRILTISKKKSELSLDGEVHRIKGNIQWNGSVWEASLPLEDFGKYQYLNVMRVRQNEGNVIQIVPYY